MYTGNKQQLMQIPLTVVRLCACRTQRTLPTSSGSKRRQTRASGASGPKLHRSPQHSWQRFKSEFLQLPAATRKTHAA